MRDFGISDNVLSQVIKTIKSFRFVSKAVIFGSRAKDSHKKYSDVDICLFGKIDGFDAERVRSALDELNVIYCFDVVAYNDIKSAALRDHIDRTGVEIYAEQKANSTT